MNRARHFPLLLALLMLLAGLWCRPAPGAESVQLEVVVEGLDDDLENNALGFLEIERRRKDPHLNELWIKRLHKRAPGEIRRALQPFGYYDAKVTPRLEQTGPGRWRAVYRVDPGPRTRVTEVNIRLTGEGADEPALKEAVKRFPLKPGDPLVHAAYEKGKEALIEKAAELGYPDVEVKLGRILVDPRRHSARIELAVDTGRLYHIAAIRLHQDVLDPDFVERYLADVHPGDVYSQEKLQAIQKDLIDTGYFSLVDVNPHLDQAKDARAPVDVTLEPAKRQLYSVGIGYDTDAGIHLNGRWIHRRLNRRGHKADAFLKLSPRHTLVRGNYWIPIRDPRTTKLGFSAQLEKEQTGASDRSTLDLEAGYYLLWRQWLSELFVQYKYERFTPSGEETRTSSLFSLGARTERSAFEKGIWPRRGWGLRGEVRASPGLLSSTAFLRAWIFGRWLVPLGERGRLALRGEGGTAVVEDFDRYPNSLRFFAGGDNSIRGYDWKELGPETAQGEVIGGRHLLTFSLEYDHQVAEHWVAAGFVDGGNAFDDSLDEIYWGAGFGVRWLSPVGAVRFDLAWPWYEGHDTRLSDLHIHFGFEVNF